MKTLSSAAPRLFGASRMVRNIFTTSPPVDPSMKRLKNMPIMKSCQVRSHVMWIPCTARRIFHRTVARIVQPKKTATPTQSHPQLACRKASPIWARFSGSWNTHQSSPTVTANCSSVSKVFLFMGKGGECNQLTRREAIKFWAAASPLAMAASILAPQAASPARDMPWGSLRPKSAAKPGGCSGTA